MNFSKKGDRGISLSLSLSLSVVKMAQDVTRGAFTSKVSEGSVRKEKSRLTWIFKIKTLVFI